MEPEEANKELMLEKIEDIKEEGPKFHCEQSNTEVVDKIAQMLLPGLATACVDNTTGAFFAGPGSVAAGLRKEMEDYLIQRSETFVAESVILEGGAEVSDDPYDIISNFVDDFTTSKRTLFGRVSTWLLSDQREDKVDDFVQEIEINGFWLTDKRAILAQTLLKNVDFKTAFHCDEKFDSLEELTQHLPQCRYRSMTCQNEGCDAIFSACRLEDHDSNCPFKFITCEQKCEQTLMRRNMDRHCITVCPMRLVNCPFHSVGCQSAIPHCTIEEHCSSDLHSHLLYILQGIYKEASDDDLEQRIEQLEKASSSGQLENARDIRSLTSIVKGLESKLAPMKFSVKGKDAVEDNIDNRDIRNTDNIESKDNSNIKNNDAGNREVAASNHENKDDRYSSDMEGKDSNNGSKIENMHGTNSRIINKNQNNNGSSIEIEDDSDNGDIEKQHGNSGKIESNDGSDGTNSNNIENKHVSNINDIENSSNIENIDGNHFSHMDNRQFDNSSKVENSDVNNIGNIEIKDDTNDSNIRKYGSDSSNVENWDEVEDKHGNESSKVEKEDVNDISSIANSDDSNTNNIKEDDNNSSKLDDRDENKSRNIEHKGGNNSHKVNNKHGSDCSEVHNSGGTGNNIENRDCSSSNNIENMDSNNSDKVPSLGNSSEAA